MANSQKCLDINTASADELQTLPGIGRTRAEAIIETRTVSINYHCLKNLGVTYLLDSIMYLGYNYQYMYYH